jgi:hypothetical protein
VTDELPEERYIVLHRVTWRPANVLPTSTVVVANCGHRGWLAPSSRKFLATAEGAGCYLVCTDCISPADIEDPEEQVRAVPGAATEFDALFGPGQADRITAMLKRDWRGRR